MKLLSDTPLMEIETDPRKDALGFLAYADAIAEAVAESPGPFTVGVFGGWGCGKTSLLRIVQRKLQGSAKAARGRPLIVTVWFNAWQHEQELHPIVPLVRLLVQTIESHSKAKAAFRKAFQELSQGLRSILAGISLKGTVGIPIVGSVDVGVSAKDIADHKKSLKSETPQGKLGEQTVLSAVHAVLASAKLPKNCRIVVFIDDLDRCMPSKALQVLESIKLVLAHPCFVFVMGVANKVIEGYLDHRFQTDFGLSGVEGRKYLQKLVQLEFHLPPHAARMPVYSSHLIQQLDKAVQAEFKGLENVVTVAANENPRAAVRFVNRLLIDSNINKNLALRKQADKIALPYFAVTRALQARWPEVFRTLMASQDLCGRVAGWSPAELGVSNVLPEQSGTGNGSDEKLLAQRLFLESDLQKLLFSDHGRAWLSNHGTRQAVETFLLQLAGSAPEGRPRREVASDAFLSYRMTDRRYVEQLARLLTQSGLQLAWDVDLTPGTNWRQGLDKALVQSRSLLFFFGEETPGSEWQARERDMGFKISDQDPDFRVVPVLLPGADEKALPQELRERIWIDLRSFPQDETELQERLNPLIRLLRRPH